MTNAKSVLSPIKLLSTSVQSNGRAKGKNGIRKRGKEGEGSRNAKRVLWKSTEKREKRDHHHHHHDQSLSKLETRLWIGGFLHDWHRSSQNLNSPIPTFESPSVLVPTAHVVVDNEMPFKTTAAIAQINLIGMIKTMVDE